MRLLAAFIKMIRLPNLIFIALTQLLFYYTILQVVVNKEGFALVFSAPQLLLLLLASVFIAAAGYIINDYFDIYIDSINKPYKNVIGRIISRRWAMLLHFMLSGVGIFISFWVSRQTEMWYLVWGNILSVFLLFVYSISLKRKLLSGNVLIALLTAWVIFVLSFSETFPLFNNSEQLSSAANTKLWRLSFLYAGFAFIATLIREAIKDMEDIEGDRKHGCETMPIAWGLNAAKVYVAVWLVVLMAILLALQVYVVQFEWWLLVVYSIVFIISPFAVIFKKLFKAQSAADFHALSNYTKLGMLTGILSMVFFYFYL